MTSTVYIVEMSIHQPMQHHTISRSVLNNEAASDSGNNNNKCVTNPPFAFQIAFPRGTDFAGSKSRDLQSEISVRIECRIESVDSRLQLQC